MVISAFFGLFFPSYFGLYIAFFSIFIPLWLFWDQLNIFSNYFLNFYKYGTYF